MVDVFEVSPPVEIQDFTVPDNVRTATCHRWRRWRRRKRRKRLNLYRATLWIVSGPRRTTNGCFGASYSALMNFDANKRNARSTAASRERRGVYYVIRSRREEKKWKKKKTALNGPSYYYDSVTAWDPVRCKQTVRAHESSASFTRNFSRV